MEKLDSLVETALQLFAGITDAAQLEQAKARFIATLDGEVRRLLVELESTERELPADVRGLYDRVVKQKGEDCMAPLDGQSCGGCFHQVTGNMQSELLMGRVVTCRTCGPAVVEPAGRVGDEQSIA